MSVAPAAPAHPETTPETPHPAYAQWLDRLSCTHRALTYTCTHRLRDVELAEQVSVQVVGGLLAKPKIFRYFGLPFSGRIARFAEQRIAEAKDGRLQRGCSWPDLWDELHALDSTHQVTFIGACVEGHGDAALADLLHCSETEAAVERDRMVTALRRIAGQALAPAVDDLPD